MELGRALDGVDYDTISEIYELGTELFGLEGLHLFLTESKTKEGTNYYSLLDTKEGIKQLKQIMYTAQDKYEEL